MWSNADEVKAFIEDHKAGRWDVGDRFVLPDIEQPYTVVAVRPFRHRGKFKLFVDLEAPCAVENCEEYLIVTKEVHQWMASPYLPRCCADHKFGFSTPMQNAWKTEEDRAKIAARPAPKPKPAPVPRLGVNERAVMGAVDALGLVADEVPVDVLIRHAIGLLPAPVGAKRDTRKQCVVRAIASLVGTQHVVLRGGVVVL